MMVVVSLESLGMAPGGIVVENVGIVFFVALTPAGAFGETGALMMGRWLVFPPLQWGLGSFQHVDGLKV